MRGNEREEKEGASRLHNAGQLYCEDYITASVARSSSHECVHHCNKLTFNAESA